MVGQPQILKEDIEAVDNVVKTGWWVNGPQVKQLSEEFKQYIGSKYAVSVSSGTAALHLSMVALGLKQGDEVITSPFTFPATAGAIQYVGATPVLVDIERDTLNIDASKIEKAITKRTKAIMPIHVSGLPCDMDKIIQLASKYNLYVVEDACHAIESWYKGQKIGTIGDLTCFSFDVTKNVAGGMGGVVVTNNSKLAEKISELAHFSMVSKGPSVPYDVVDMGFKYDMTEFSAAIARKQLERVNKNHEIREKYWKIYNDYFKNSRAFEIIKEQKGIIHARHLYMILLKLENLNCSRFEFLDKLAQEGVIARIRFPSLHLLTYYKKTLDYKYGDFPVSEWASERVFSPPLSPALKQDEIIHIASTINNVADKFLRSSTQR